MANQEFASKAGTCNKALTKESTSITNFWTIILSLVSTWLDWDVTVRFILCDWLLT